MEMSSNYCDYIYIYVIYNLFCNYTFAVRSQL